MVVDGIGDVVDFVVVVAFVVVDGVRVGDVVDFVVVVGFVVFDGVWVGDMVYLVVVVGFVVVDCVGECRFRCCSRFCGSWRVR